jgi:20S proteasome subunit beta 5
MPITPEIFELSVSNDRIKNGIRHGTTTLAFKYKEGIIVAVDSRATAGSFIGKNTNKT